MVRTLVNTDHRFCDLSCRLKLQPCESLAATLELDLLTASAAFESRAPTFRGNAPGTLSTNSLLYSWRTPLGFQSSGRALTHLALGIYSRQFFALDPDISLRRSADFVAKFLILFSYFVSF